MGGSYHYLRTPLKSFILDECGNNICIKKGPYICIIYALLWYFTYIPLRTFALPSLDIIRPTFKGVFDHMVCEHRRLFA